LRSPSGGPSGLFLDVYQQVRPRNIGRSWYVLTHMYEYRLLDHDQTELLVYHWQPGLMFQGPDHPHLHVSASLRAQVNAQEEQSIALDRLHVVTGLVTLGAIVRMLISEFRIAPGRSDWQQTLTRTASVLGEEAITSP
jgi:hypothetical protein